MGTAASTANDETVSHAGSDKGRSNSAKDVSRQIDRQLLKEKEEKSQKFQILLLGGSECGKTTIFKQMKYTIWVVPKVRGFFTQIFPKNKSTQ
jgi:polynucleotide 5'-kinase involved in rRNA processing